MIKRLYIHNYRCLVNFEMTLQGINLLLGKNGSGKSAMLAALDAMTRFVTSQGSVSDFFPMGALTRWTRQETPNQSFEMDIVGNGGVYQYSLTIEHNTDRRVFRMLNEKLLFDAQPLFVYENESAQLYNDHHRPGPSFPIDWSRSGVGFLTERSSNKKLTWFKKRVQRIHALQIIPSAMQAESTEERPYPGSNLAQFVSWYRWQSDENAHLIRGLFEDLAQIIPGFSGLNLSDAGRAKIMQVVIGKEMRLAFDELSDGQKTLIALYALLHFLPEDGATLCLDEPENFLALSEIQPWFDQMYEASATGDRQFILITHNPRVINLLALKHGQWFYREGPLAPTRIRRVSETPGDTGMTMADLVERGGCSMNNSPQIIILCEDDHHYHMARHFLIHRGVNGRHIVSNYPSGQQDAKQYIRTHFETEAGAILNKRHKRKIALIVISDADTQTMEQRKRFLTSNAPIAPDAPIAFIIPKRNVETWFKFLDDGSTNEVADHANQYAKPGVHPTQYGDKLHNWCANHAPPTGGIPPSLLAACQEWQRLKQILDL